MFPCRSLVRTLATVVALLTFCASRVSALDMPSPFVQEVLVKSVLVSLSDAVAYDNFTVLNAKISKPFREQFPPEKLRAVFKDLIDKRAVFDAIVAKPMVPDGEPKIDEILSKKDSAKHPFSPK